MAVSESMELSGTLGGGLPQSAERTSSLPGVCAVSRGVCRSRRAVEVVVIDPADLWEEGVLP